jgi:hypothetical protein
MGSAKNTALLILGTLQSGLCGKLGLRASNGLHASADMRLLRAGPLTSGGPQIIVLFRDLLVVGVEVQHFASARSVCLPL